MVFILVWEGSAREEEEEGLVMWRRGETDR